MEPTKAKVTDKINYVIYSSVAHVGKYDEIVGGYLDKETNKPMVIKEDRGWFVRFDGSQERMCFGSEEPQLKLGDKVKITIEKLP